ncbi:stage II sporulation protein M [Bacillus paramycoides]|uniref:stage II sporulation protein M n=1 Tax=Bacillus paramycoides TaxID=2026194 RepID=UPI003801604A
MKKSLYKLLTITLLLLSLFLIIGIYIGLNLNFSYTYTDDKINGFSGVFTFFFHNIVFILINILGIFCFGIPSILILIWNGILFGISIGFSYHNGMSILEIILRLSHGIFEIPSLLISASIGMLGFYFYSSKNKKQLLILSIKLSFLSIILLFLASIFEANITDYLVELYISIR